MQPDVIRKLLDLNQVFYRDFGSHFSATRQRLQPGVHQIISQLITAEKILDLGCGNGEFARQLGRGGFKGQYTGLDFSPSLLEAARTQTEGSPAIFLQADLTSQDWDAALPPNTFAVITAFAVLHHIPSLLMRKQIMQKAGRLLATGGSLFLSNWQFLNSPRLVERIQSWDQAGLSSSDVDEGDYLLDWRSGGQGLRYAHSFSEGELLELAEDTGFRVVQTFYSDGENNRLGLYQRWEKKAID